MSVPANLNGLQTEQRNPRTEDIDIVSTFELCQKINNEDSTVAQAVKECIPTIADAIDALAPRVRSGGRIIYVGAGTSGRLAVLDASEIPPTYSALPSQFVALIAGGDVALRTSQEGAEDSVEGAVADLDVLSLDGKLDSLIGVAASGRTPYVLSSLRYAKSRGCIAIGVACSAPSAMSTSGNVDFMINPLTGPEVVTGSTRMKAGTATKLVLNMLSTGVMIRTGKTFGNIMIDVKPTNFKLQLRARRIIREICGDRCLKSDEELDALLLDCDRNVKVAVTKLYLGISVAEANIRLKEVNGVLAKILKDPHGSPGEGTSVQNDKESQYVLCIDGGASRCRAVILGSDGEKGTGEAGPCNPADVGVEPAVAAIASAIQQAIDSCPGTKCKGIQRLTWKDAWIGIAGGDRKPLDERVHFAMVKLLGENRQMNLSVTNDIELLATAAGNLFGTNDVIVLIAGTGSVAMRYREKSGNFSRVARSGGWGALLGDDGSGFDIGRRALRLALRQQESRPRTVSPDPLIEMILNYFRSADEQANDFDLLTSVLLSSSNDAPNLTHAKRRIAECARVVVNATLESKLAQEITDSALTNLLDLVLSVKFDHDENKSLPILVATGGLMESKIMQQGLLERLKASGARFDRVEFVHQPASVGVRYLAQRAWDVAK